MKKWVTLLLCCALAMGLAACGADMPGGQENGDSPENRLHFEVTTSVYENEYKADDGTLLLGERYELPMLELRTEDGELYTLAENVTANGGAAEPAQITAQNAFNTEMNNVLAGLQAEASQMSAEGKSLYMNGGSTAFTSGGWVSELNVTGVHMTETGLLSAAAESYTYYGGAHPNSSTRTWNFDLTTGEFLTLDALASEEGDLQGSSLQDKIYRNISSQIREKNLSEGYFDDYDSYLNDFSTLAALNFTKTGLTVTFDPYLIAPYAAGAQVFDVPYSVFYSALNEHAKTLLAVSQEQTVLSDFDTAATLWSWFYMDDPPMDYNVTAEIDGNLYYLADIKGVETLEDLRALLLWYVTPELADEWLNSAEQRYRDIDGRLYVMSAGRGGNESLGGYTCTAALDGGSGVLTQTVTLLAWDDTAQTWTDTGKTEAYEYPFTLVDGHAVFSAFPYPY